MTFSAATLRSELAALLPRLRRSAPAIAWQGAADDLLQLGIACAPLRSNQSEAGARLFRIIKNAWIDGGARQPRLARGQRCEEYCPIKRGPYHEI